MIPPRGLHRARDAPGAARRVVHLGAMLPGRRAARDEDLAAREDARRVAVVVIDHVRGHGPYRIYERRIAGVLAPADVHTTAPRPRWDDGPSPRRPGILVVGAAAHRHLRAQPFSRRVNDVWRRHPEPRRPRAVQKLQRVGHEPQADHSAADGDLVMDLRRSGRALEMDPVLRSVDGRPVDDVRAAPVSVPIDHEPSSDLAFDVTSSREHDLRGGAAVDIGQPESAACARRELHRRSLSEAPGEVLGEPREEDVAVALPFGGRGRDPAGAVVSLRAAGGAGYRERRGEPTKARAKPRRSAAPPPARDVRERSHREPGPRPRFGRVCRAAAAPLLEALGGPRRARAVVVAGERRHAVVEGGARVLAAPVRVAPIRRAVDRPAVLGGHRVIAVADTPRDAHRRIAVVPG